MAFETLTEPTYDEPAEPVIPERFYNYKDKSAEDPEYKSKSLCYRMLLSMYTEEIKSSAATLAAEHLFYVGGDNKDKLLPEEQAQEFRRTTSQLLFMCARARPDIRTAVFFYVLGAKNLMRMTGVS